MNKNSLLNKKTFIFLMLVLLIIICGGVIFSINYKKSIVINGKEDFFRSGPDCLFSDFENLDRKICGQRIKEEIYKESTHSELSEIVEENFKNYPDLAGYYLPKNFIDSIDYLDIDKDGQDEKVVYYSCHGCNALPRNVDIIKDGRIIFSAKGGNLSVKENKELFPGFILSDSGLVLLKSEGYTMIKFKQNISSDYIPYEEYDVKYTE